KPGEVDEVTGWFVVINVLADAFLKRRSRDRKLKSREKKCGLFGEALFHRTFWTEGMRKKERNVSKQLAEKIFQSVGR
ncbi:10248_t:CDS:1, partial [Acaulospora colombiana]